MSDNFLMQVASLGSRFKSKLIGGVHHPGHISYKEDGSPVDHATETTSAAILEAILQPSFQVELPDGAATSANQGAANSLLSDIDSTLGARADTTWDGASAASGIALWRYIGSKMEAVRGLIAGTLTFALPAGAATASNQTTANGTLSSILTALQGQRAETVWTDDSGAFYIRNDTGGTITWMTVTGGASSGPGTGARPSGGSAVIVDRVSYQATANGTGYSTGDVLEHFVTVDPASGAVVGHFWINSTTEALIAAPSSANITPISVLPSGAATAANQSTQITSLAAINTAIGATTGAAVITDAAGTLQQYLRGLVKLVAAKIGITIADGDHATVGVTTGAAVITDAAGTLQQYLRGLVKLVAAKIGVTIADGDQATIGAKADATWDGAAAASGISLWRYIGTKAEAVRAALVASLPASLGQKIGANSLSVVLSSDGPFATNFGLTSDAAQTDHTQTASHMAFLKGVIATLKTGLQQLPGTLSSGGGLKISTLADTAQLTHAVVSQATSGAANLVAADGLGKAILCYELVLVAAGTVTVQLQDGATNLTGAMTLIAGVPLVLPFTGEPHTVGTGGLALNLNLGGAVQVSGYLRYKKV